MCWIYVVFQGKAFVTRNTVLFKPVPLDRLSYVSASKSVARPYPFVGDICLKYIGLQETHFLALGLKPLGSGRNIRACLSVITNRFSEGI